MSALDYGQLLEKELRHKFSRKYCLFTGRGTTAIYLALKASGLRGEALFPAIICNSAPDAAVYAGMRPRFFDVRQSDFNGDLASLEASITHDTRAIVAAHLFGQATEMDSIIDLARKKRMLVVEDACQSIGGRYKGEPMGSYGDVSIFSFGPGKIIDAGGGGAILTDNERLYKKAKALNSRLPAEANKTQSGLYRGAYYSLARLPLGMYAAFAPLTHLFRGMYLSRGSESQAAAAYGQLQELDDITAKRVGNAKKYSRLLKHKSIIQPVYNHKGGTYYRYSVLADGVDQRRLSDAIRAQGIHVSNLYRPVHRMYLEPRGLPNSDFVGTHILNFWVSPNLEAGYVEKCCSAVKKAVNELS